MTVRPNINNDDRIRFRASINRPDVEFYIWSELWPDLIQFDNDPRCHIDGCLICNGVW